MRIHFFIFFLILGGILLQDVHAQKQATLLDHKDRIRISKLNVLNSSARETNLSITPDGKYLFFMSLRGGQVWSNSYMTFQGDSVYDGDIWYSRKINGRWSKPKCMPYNINSSQGEDEPNISPDGKRVYFQSWHFLWRQTGGPYYVSGRTETNWTKPLGLGGGITEFFKSPYYQATDGMTVSPDEKTLIVAAGQDYDGNMDLYYSKRKSNGWTFCKRLPVSTPYDDRSAFLAADGKTLYFASNGYKGYGGLDIFKTTINPDGTHGEVINVGKPFNTPGDDYGLILTGDGMEGYFVRNGDIYFADLKQADPRIRPNPTNKSVEHAIAGTVRDSVNWKGIPASVVVINARTKIPVNKIKTQSNGKYSFNIPNRSAEYDAIVMAKGYKTKRRRIKVQPATFAQKITVNFLLGKVPPPPVSKAPDPIPESQTKDPVVSTTPKTQKEPKEPTRDTKIGKMETPIPKGPSELPQKNKAPELPPEKDPYDFTGVAQNNLILLLDVSASMKQADRLPLLKEAFANLLSYMRPEDRISVVVFSSDAKVLIEGVSAIEKDRILKSIDKLGGGGGTKSKSALKKTQRLAIDNMIPAGNNRIIMATDGYMDAEALYNTASKISNQNIALSIFSFGRISPRREKGLQQLADLGGGNYKNITRGNVDKALLEEAKAVRKK
ncbi:MAG: VWA domain-containing protein [Bacteroidota bacterium]